MHPVLVARVALRSSRERLKANTRRDEGSISSLLALRSRRACREAAHPALFAKAVASARAGRVRSGGKSPLAALDNEMDALGAALARRCETHSQINLTYSLTLNDLTRAPRYPLTLGLCPWASAVDRLPVPTRFRWNVQTGNPLLVNTLSGLLPDCERYVSGVKPSPDMLNSNRSLRTWPYRMRRVRGDGRGMSPMAGWYFQLNVSGLLFRQRDKQRRAS